MLTKNNKDMTNVSEIWKPCFNYENYFEVSNIGRVRKKDSLKILKQSINLKFVKQYFKKQT